MSDRLSRLLALVGREDAHLQGVRQRLFSGVVVDDLDAASVEAWLADPDGIDRVESFGAKFSRMQDTVMDKLIPAFLDAAGEIPGTAIDNLDRLERLGLVRDAEQWLAMRRLRNRLVHEYIESAADMVPALRAAYSFADDLSETYGGIAEYSRQRRLV
ncbi:HepT-like ribonuclease domain-containing protein [Aquisalimonas sp. APHAB1-3]|uniref:HepT-like ribonuclease domain-containing protein n=1 Tax=Aquisalimonas sp. APHAB1-3 TaxID=3402080 RepID=UPI003AAA28C7